MIAPPVTAEGLVAAADDTQAVLAALEVERQSAGSADLEPGREEEQLPLFYRYEVQPGDNALRCLDCHGPDGRLDWTGLGYEADPMAAVMSASH